MCPVCRVVQQLDPYGGPCESCLDAQAWTERVQLKARAHRLAQRVAREAVAELQTMLTLGAIHNHTSRVIAFRRARRQQ